MMNTSKSKKLLIALSSLLMCIIIVLSCFLADMHEKYIYIKRNNDGIFAGNFAQLCSALGINDTADKAEYYAKAHTYAQLSLSVFYTSSYSEYLDLRSIISTIDEMNILKILYDPECLPQELISDLMYLAYNTYDPELAKTVKEELLSIMRERRAAVYFETAAFLDF